MLQNAIVNWWANGPINLPPTACPSAPNGETQAAAVVVAANDWSTLYNYALLVTIVIVLLGVLATYYTRSMGARFTRRWWLALLLTAATASVASLIVLSEPGVQTFGCEYGERTTNIPFPDALSRTLVSLVQSLLLFFIGSFLLTRLVRIGRWQPWFNNSRYPF
jgi:hypothetical protein